MPLYIILDTLHFLQFSGKIHDDRTRWDYFLMQPHKKSDLESRLVHTGSWSDRNSDSQQAETIKIREGEKKTKAGLLS